ATIDEQLQKLLVFGLRAAAPAHHLRLEQRARLFDKGKHLRIGRLCSIRRNLRCFRRDFWLYAHAGGFLARIAGLRAKGLVSPSTERAKLSRQGQRQGGTRPCRTGYWEPV